MDELGFHPYPNRTTIRRERLRLAERGHANLDRIKQAVWDAFHGTAQTPFAERRMRGTDRVVGGWWVGNISNVDGKQPAKPPTGT